MRDVAVVRFAKRRTDTDLMPKKKTQKPPRVYRDAATGRFVTKKYAKKHPKRTVKEPRTFVWAASADDGRAAPTRAPLGVEIYEL